MLQVAVDDGHDRRRGRTHPLDTGGGKPAPADPLDHAHPRVPLAKFARRVRRAVGAVVVDENRLPPPPHQCLVELRHEDGDVGAFVEGRNDDRDLQRGGRAIDRVAHQSRASTASAMSPVDSVPPRSAVRAPPAIAAATAASIRAAAASIDSEWRSSIAADRIAAHGLALP